MIRGHDSYAGRVHVGDCLLNIARVQINAPTAIAYQCRFQSEFDRIVNEKRFLRSPSAAFAVGDASFHSGWTLHSAEPNRSPTLREAMTMIYYADGTNVGPLDHPARRFDRDVWLAGCEPGQLAAGPLNPLLYSVD